MLAAPTPLSLSIFSYSAYLLARWRLDVEASVISFTVSGGQTTFVWNESHLPSLTGNCKVGEQLMAEDRFEGKAERYITQTLIRNILQNDAFPRRDVLKQKNKKSFSLQWADSEVDFQCSSCCLNKSFWPMAENQHPISYHLWLVVLSIIINGRYPRCSYISILENNLTHLSFSNKKVMGWTNEQYNISTMKR